MSWLRHADEYERKCSVLSHRKVCVGFGSTLNRCELKGEINNCFDFSSSSLIHPLERKLPPHFMVLFECWHPRMHYCGCCIPASRRPGMVTLKMEAV